MEFTISLMYAATVVFLYRFPNTPAGYLVHQWVALTGLVANGIFSLVPRPTTLIGSEWSAKIAMYHHILFVCMIFAVSSFIRSEAYIIYWASIFQKSAKTISSSSITPQQIALKGYGLMTSGVVAVMLLALFGEFQMPTLAPYLFVHSWTYVRAPILMAIAYAFACNGLAFKICSSRYT